MLSRPYPSGSLGLRDRPRVGHACPSRLDQPFYNSTWTGTWTTIPPEQESPEVVGSGGPEGQVGEVPPRTGHPRHREPGRPSCRSPFVQTWGCVEGGWTRGTQGPVPARGGTRRSPGSSRVTTGNASSDRRVNKSYFPVLKYVYSS